jgi:uncharacterized protein
MDPRMLVVVGLGAMMLAACSAGDSTDRAAPADPVTTEVATEDAAPAGDTVTVVGQGEVRGRPDVVRATVGVEVTADSADRALETASARASDVIDALREAGVAEDDIQTQELSLRDQRERPPRPEPGAEAPTGEVAIVAVNVLEVRIRDVDDAAGVLAAVSDAAGDVTRIRGLRFEVSETEPLLERARELAFEDAQRKAEQYAGLAGRELGELVSIREHGASPRPSAPTRLEEADAAAVPVQPGTLELTVQITAVWSLG